MKHFRTFLSIFDPCRIVSLHRKLIFLSSMECGSGLRVTHRAELFLHGEGGRRASVGENALIDGTIEVYANGRLSIGKNFFLGRSRIYCAESIEIGDYVLVSDAVCIMDSSLHSFDEGQRRRVADLWAKGVFPDVYTDVSAKPVVIEDDVWIGYGACVMPGVRLGQGSIVGAGSVVVRDVPPRSVVAGNPARLLRGGADFGGQ